MHETADFPIWKHSAIVFVAALVSKLFSKKYSVSMRVFNVILLGSVLSGCASLPPANGGDICKVFDDKKSWYKSAQKSAKKWGGNIHVPMAIMYQESAFQARARPPMQYFLGLIPTGRASDAYGYPQALDSTWKNYQRQAGSRLSRRSHFPDAIDFIQWYMHQTALRNKIPKTDAYRHYLNYHEGQGGYAKGSYKNKSWLIKVAKRVERRANQYAQQLQKCSAALDRKRRWLF